MLHGYHMYKFMHYTVAKWEKIFCHYNLDENQMNNQYMWKHKTLYLVTIGIFKMSFPFFSPLSPRGKYVYLIHLTSVINSIPVTCKYLASIIFIEWKNWRNKPLPEVQERLKSLLSSEFFYLDVQFKFMEFELFYHINYFLNTERIVLWILYKLVHESEVAQSCPTLCNPMDTRLLRLWDFLGKSTGVGCHFLLQGTFLTQGLNPGLPHCRQTLYHLSHQGSPIGA